MGRAFDRRIQVLLGCLLLLLIAVLASPLVFGWLIEQQLRQRVQALNQALPLKIALIDYQRGWAESRFTTEIHLPGFSVPLRASHQIAHGPLYLGALNLGEHPLLSAWAESRRAPNSTRLLGLGPVPLRSRFDLDGSFAASLDLPVQHAALSDDGALQGEGLRAHFRHTAAGARGWFSMAGLRWQHGLDIAEINDLDLLLSRRGEAEWPAVGELQLELSQWQQQSRNSQLRIKNLTLRAASTADGPHLNLDIELLADSLALGDRRISQPRLQLVVRRLPRALWQWLGSGSLHALGGGELGTEGFFLELLRQLPPGVEFEVARAVLSVDDLPFEGWVRASLCAPPQRAERLLDWLPAICLRGELAAEEGPLIGVLERETGQVIRTESFGVIADLSAAEAEALVRPSVEAQLTVLVSQGYIEYRDGRYHAELALRDGVLSVGGQSLRGLSFVR